MDHARRVRSEKRGGGSVKLPLLESDGHGWQLDERLIALDEALTQLQQLDERPAKVIELRFFAGLSEEQAAKVLDISVADSETRLGLWTHLARQPPQMMAKVSAQSDF